MSSDRAVIHLDFETRSAADLKKVGMYRYMGDETTNAWCAAFAIGDEPVDAWRLGEDPPKDLMYHIGDGALVYAHNAGFEMACLRYVMAPKHGWKIPELRQMRCTAAMAAAMGLPRHLAGAGEAMGLEIQKDMKGKRVMMQLMKPKNKAAPYIWWNDEAKFKILVDYCKIDVEVERLLEKKLRPLSAFEQEVWFLDQQINSRGVLVDAKSVNAAHHIVREELDKLDAELARLTRQQVSSASKVLDLKRWLQSQGVDVDSVDKESIKEALKTVENPVIRRVLEIRQEAGKSSTAKLVAFRDRASKDGRARDNLMYHGAHTGRWSGVGIQMQNLPRTDEAFDEGALNQLFDILPERDSAMVGALFGPPLSAISNALRGMIVAPKGKLLMMADFANIEGRVLAWLAGEKWKLQAFRDYDSGTGPDLYKLAASSIYGVHVSAVTKPQRQIGKVAELACGYQGGVGAFQTMATTYGVKVPDEQAEQIKTAWREAHPETVAFWHALDNAAMAATLRRNEKFTVGKIAFARAGNILWCRLPSGRFISYVDPKILPVQTPWGATRDAVTYMATDSVTRKWMRHKAYGGLFAENITQAVARDIMAEAMVRVEKANYPVILTVHDEVISEVDETRADVHEFDRLMCTLPTWATGLPVTAGAECAKRYKK